MTLSIRAIVASAVLLASSSIYAASPVFTLQTGLGSENIGDDPDEFYYLTGAAAWSKPSSKKGIFDLQAEISTYEYRENDDVSSDEIFLQGSYSHTPGSGFRAPTYSIALRYLEEFAENDDFDASTATLILAAAFRIDDRTRALGGLKAGYRDAETDLESNPVGAYINLDFLTSPRFLIYTTLGADRGAFNIRSYCSGAYNADLYTDMDMDMDMGYGYRMHHDDSTLSGDCDRRYLTLGGNYSINSSNTLDFAVSYNDYDTPAGKLDGNIYTIDYFYRF